MTLPIETASVGDEYARRALDVVAQQFPVGPAQLLARSVTALPASPIDGMEVFYVADAANGVRWHLRYNSSTGKWESLGGPALVSQVATNEQTASAVYVDLATVGPSVTLPLAGDYDIEWFVSMGSVAGSATPLAAVKFGASAAVDADSASVGAVAVNNGISAGRHWRYTGLTAATVVKLQYRTTVGTMFAVNRYLAIRPVKVS